LTKVSQRDTFDEEIKMRTMLRLEVVISNEDKDLLQDTRKMLAAMQRILWHTPASVELKVFEVDSKAE